MPTTTENAKFVQGQHKIPMIDERSRAIGIVAQNYPISAAASSTVMVTQTPYYALTFVNEGDTCTNVQIWNVAAASAQPTNFYAALYTGAGVQKAITADVAATVSTNTGILTFPFTTAFVAPAGLYYVAILCVMGAGTLPAPGRSTSAGSVKPGAGSLFVSGKDSSTATTFPTTPTIVASVQDYWMAIT